MERIYHELQGNTVNHKHFSWSNLSNVMFLLLFSHVVDGTIENWSFYWFKIAFWKLIWFFLLKFHRHFIAALILSLPNAHLELNLNPIFLNPQILHFVKKVRSFFAKVRINLAEIRFSFLLKKRRELNPIEVIIRSNLRPGMCLFLSWS